MTTQRPFCAECLDPIYGEGRRAPLGRNGAMVMLCATCGSAHVDPYKTPKTRRQRSMDRQDKLRALNLCINGPMQGDTGREGIKHGPVHKGGRCLACWCVKLAADAEHYKTHGKRRERRAA